MTAQTILPANSVTGGYDVANSCRFNTGSADTLSINMGTSSSRRIWTLSTWIKLSRDTNADNINIVGTGASDDQNHIGFDGSGSVGNTKIALRHHNGTSSDIHIQSNANYNDQSAWYHVVYSVDTTQGTDTNRVKIYVNGTQVTSLATSTYPSQNYDWDFFQNGATTYIGRRGHSSAYLLPAYLAETVWIDGTQLTPTSFGEFDEDSGIWKPISVSGLTFGDAGFYLETKQSGTSQNSSGLGADTSGNDNHFAVNNLTAIDQTTDTCTNNFATMNSLAVPPANAPTFTEGNLKISTNNANANPVLSTIGVSQGKWYVECKRISFDSGSADDGFRIGFGTTHVENVNLVPPGISNSGHYFMIGNGTVYNGSTDLGDKAGDSNISDDGVVGIALDLDNNRISWSFDGVWMTGSNAWSGSSPSSYVDIASGYTYFFLQTDGSTGRGYTAGWNFGGTSAFAISSGNADANGHGNFEFAPPSGYFALCTKNLAEYG